MNVDQAIKLLNTNHPDYVLSNGIMSLGSAESVIEKQQVGVNVVIEIPQLIGKEDDKKPITLKKVSTFGIADNSDFTAAMNNGIINAVKLLGLGE